jgi:hypothetical protein
VKGADLGTAEWTCKELEGWGACEGVGVSVDEVWGVVEMTKEDESDHLGTVHLQRHPEECQRSKLGYRLDRFPTSSSWALIGIRHG